MKTRTDYNATVEDQIRVDVAEAKRGIEELKASIAGLKTSIDNIGKTNGLNNFNKQIKQTTGIGKNVKSILGFGTVVAGARKAWLLLKEMTNESVDFVESTNLFNVSMGKGLQGLNQYYEKAVKFQNDLQEKLGVNIAESMNYQALFNSMSKSMGISAKYAYTLSENFTKLGYDLASLYNIDPQNAMQKLRAGLAGQTKPLRDLGLDITQQSLQPIVEKLGIKNSKGEVESVKNMSQAEKMILRYIAVLNQAKIAQGDFANTMDSPANQLRIFNAQVVAFKRNMGNLWQGFLGGILPYVNGIMMVINELLKMVAKLFGFKVSEQKVNISANIGADDLANDLGTAGKKAKELKAQLMGFDEINNISLQDKNNGSSSDGTSIGGIDQRLLDAMKEYDNMMNKVKNKATDIRDNIMKWLGFTKKINPLTGEISWELQDGNTNLKKILNTAKIIVGLYLGTKALKLIGHLKTLKDVIKGIIAPTTNFQKGLLSVSNAFKGTVTAGKTLITNFKYYKALGATTGQAFVEAGKDMMSLIPTSVKVIGGLTGLVGSCSLAYNSMKDLSEGTISTNEAILKLSGSFAGATTSGAILGGTIGSIVPGIGTLAGAITGGLVGALGAGISALIGYKDETDKLCTSISESKKKSDEYIQSIKDQKKAIEDNLNNGLAQIEYTKKLADELTNLVDANGKVKSGYEDRVNFILNQLNEAYGTEYKAVDGIIEKYDELKNNINKIIETKRAEITLNAYQEEYENALKRQIGNQHLKKKAQEELTKATENYNAKMQEIIEKYGSLEEAEKRAANGGMVFAGEAYKMTDDLRKLKEGMQEAQQEVDNYTNIIKEDNETIILWEDLKTATISENADEIKRITQELTNTYEIEGKKQIGTIDEQLSNEIDRAKERERIWEENGIAINETNREQLEIGIRTLADKLVEQTNTIETLTDDQLNAWRILAESSEEIYNEKISNVNEDTKIVLETLLGEIDINSPEYIERWRKLASESKEKYNEALSKLPKDTSKRIQEMVDEINKKQWQANEAGVSLANEVERGVNTVNTEEAGKQAVNGVADGINKNKNSWSLSKALKGLKDTIVGGLKGMLGIHSPSTVMRDLVGKFIPLGIAEGIDVESNSVYASIKKLNEGIKVNTNDFKIDANQFIEYGQISGAISTQSKINVDNNMIERMGQACYNAFVNAMKTQGIKADVKVETDKDGIFKVVQTGAEEYAMQTGENPFPVMA